MVDIGCVCFSRTYVGVCLLIFSACGCLFHDILRLSINSLIEPQDI